MDVRDRYVGIKLEWLWRCGGLEGAGGQGGPGSCTGGLQPMIKAHNPGRSILILPLLAFLGLCPLAYNATGTALNLWVASMLNILRRLRGLHSARDPLQRKEEETSSKANGVFGDITPRGSCKN
jgi:hypothetical protein